MKILILNSGRFFAVLNNTCKSAGTLVLLVHIRRHGHIICFCSRLHDNCKSAGTLVLLLHIRRHGRFFAALNNSCKSAGTLVSLLHIRRHGMGVLFFLGYTSVISRFGRNFSRPTVYCSFFKVGKLLPSLSSYCQPLPLRAAFMAATAVCQVTFVPSTFVAPPLSLSGRPLQ